MDFFYWLGRQFGAEGGMAYREWYLSLDLPFFAPPPWVFGAAWGLIYPLIAIALLWTLYLLSKRQVTVWFGLLFLINIALNLTFSATTLASKSPMLASVHILGVLVSLVWLEALAWKRTKTVFFLLLPYLLWGAFATVLQITIAVLN